MARQGPLIVAALLSILLVPGTVRPQPLSDPTVGESTPIEDRPYQIELHLGTSISSRIDDARKQALLTNWRRLVHRFVGEAWSIEIAPRPSPLISDDLERLAADDLEGFDSRIDKVWLVRVTLDPEDGGLVFLGREYDTATRWLGPLQRRKSVATLDAPRTFFHFTQDLFSPTALIVGQEGGRALLKVQAAAIPPADEVGVTAPQGTTFIPIRLVTARDDSIIVNRIAYTYLTVESLEGSTARCTIVSAFRDPLSQRVARPNTLTALGIKPGHSSLRLRFLDKTTQAPAAGYTLTERPATDGSAREIGVTDRAGRIEVQPGPAREVVKLRLLAGTSEPIAEFPMMPGESTEEREISIDPLPIAAKYQVRLEALRDTIVDQVALRARLERLMQARLEGEDWDGLQTLIKQYERLPIGATFADTLKALREEVSKEAYESTRTTVLTRNLQTQFGDLEGLIDGYLTNDVAQTFIEAIQERNARVEAEKAASKKSQPVAAPVDPAPDTP